MVTRTRVQAAMGLLLAVTPTARAEMSPLTYARMQADAPECLRIRVRDVAAVGAGVGRDVTVTAEVVAVTRSAAGVHVGDVVRIRYATKVGGPITIGAAPVPVPKVGQTCPAFLSHTGDVFAPAALGWTFSVMDVRAGASEVLVVDVMSAVVVTPPRPGGGVVDHDDETYSARMELTATVRDVRTTATGRKAGDRVFIEYTLDDTSPPKTIARGQAFVAYLHQRSNSTILYPAAGFLTFEPIAAPATTAAASDRQSSERPSSERSR